MTIQERLAAQPEMMVASCVIWVLIVIWVVSMINWTIQGDVDLPFGIIGVGLALGLGVVAIAPPNPNLVPFILMAVLATVALFVPMRSALERRELVAIDIEAIERAYQQLEERPNNVGARFRIAKLVYQRGFVGHAITIADDALKSMAEEFFPDEHKLVAMWKRQEIEPSAFRALPCVECGLSNPPGELYCARCKAPFLLDQAKGKWIGRTLGRKLLASWIALMGVLIGIPVAAMVLPTPAAIVAVLGITLLVMTVLYAAFLGEKMIGQS